MRTLQEIMDLNENFEKQVKAAPNCRWDEGQALQKHYLNCVEQWLRECRYEVRNIEFDLITKLLQMVSVKEIKS